MKFSLTFLGFTFALISSAHSIDLGQCNPWGPCPHPGQCVTDWVYFRCISQNMERNEPGKFNPEYCDDNESILPSILGLLRTQAGTSALIGKLIGHGGNKCSYVACSEQVISSTGSIEGHNSKCIGKLHFLTKNSSSIVYALAADPITHPRRNGCPVNLEFDVGWTDMRFNDKAFAAVCKLVDIPIITVNPIPLSAVPAQCVSPFM